MKYDINWKVQITTSDLHVGCYREVFYRILPSELPLIKRIFCRNPWRKFYYAMPTTPTLGYYFSAKEYSTILKKLTTFGEVLDYLSKEKEKQKELYYKELEKRNFLVDKWCDSGTEECKTTSFPPDMDKDCIALCNALNKLPGVETYESCCGHLKTPYRIFFRCRNFVSLAILARAFDKRYLTTSMLWKIEVETGDSHPTYCFYLSSKEAYSRQEDMDNDLNIIIHNIEYWSGNDFKEYFETNNGN